MAEHGWDIPVLYSWYNLANDSRQIFEFVGSDTSTHPKY